MSRVVEAVGDLLVREWARIWLASKRDASRITEEAITMLCRHVLEQDVRIDQLKSIARRMLDGHTLDADGNHVGDCDDCDAKRAAEEMRRLV